MTFKEKKAMCEEFVEQLKSELGDGYAWIWQGKTGNSRTCYIFQRGALDQITYHSKPVYSFRYSDNWSWYESEKKCPDLDYIQCYNADLPRPKMREAEGAPSKRVLGIQVAIMGTDDQYHAIYGEVYDRKEKTWTWKDNTPEEAAYYAQCMLDYEAYKASKKAC